MLMITDMVVRTAAFSGRDTGRCFLENLLNYVMFLNINVSCTGIRSCYLYKNMLAKPPCPTLERR